MAYNYQLGRGCAGFIWHHVEPELILLCVRWYLRDALSKRDLTEMMSERGLSIAHTTIFRWIQRYTLEIDRRCRSHLKPTHDAWRVAETYVKVGGMWMHWYRAVDATRQTLDFLLNATRSTQAAKRFFSKVLGRSKGTLPTKSLEIHELYRRAGSSLSQAKDPSGSWVWSL